MSYYINIRKNNVELCSFSKNTIFFSAFKNFILPNEWIELKKDILEIGLKNLEENKVDIIKTKQKYEMMKELKISYDDLFNVLGNINECNEEIEDINKAINYIELFILMFMQSDETDKFEWCAG